MTREISRRQALAGGAFGLGMLVGVLTADDRPRELAGLIPEDDGPIGSVVHRGKEEWLTVREGLTHRLEADESEEYYGATLQPRASIALEPNAALTIAVES